MPIIKNIIFDLEGVLGYYENSESLIFYDDVLELTSELIADGYNLYYLTNVLNSSSKYFNQFVTKILENEGFLGGLGSNNYPYSKPDKKFYKQLSSQYKINPKESLFIDDKKSNTNSAKELGFKVLFHSSKGKNLKEQVFNFINQS